MPQGPMSDFSQKFAARSAEDAATLVLENALGWIVSQSGQMPLATVLPFRIGQSEDGQILSLRGHFARANPHLAGLRRDPRAVVLVLGPNAYVSPSWMDDRTQAPTWNYAAASFAVELRFFEDRESLEDLLDDLIGAMEAGRPKAWGAAEMGARFERLLTGIVGFEAMVVGENTRFKLGQDERDDVYADIVRGLRDEGETAVLRWMTRFNPGR